MTKLRKQQRKKKFKASVNRKRLRNKLSNKGKIKCDELKKEWEYSKTTKFNLQNMGLVYDPNSDLKVSNVRKELISKIASTSKWNTSSSIVPAKKHISEVLENEANAPRERSFELPSSQVEWVTYLMDKYGNDYKAMARDRKNYYQETWKQIRAKIKIFMGIPKQSSKYLENKGASDTVLTMEDLKTNDSDSDF